MIARRRGERRGGIPRRPVGSRVLTVVLWAAVAIGFLGLVAAAVLPFTLMDAFWPVPASIGIAGTLLLLTSSTWLLIRAGGSARLPRRLSDRDVLGLWEENRALEDNLTDLRDRNKKLESVLREARSRLDHLQQAHEADQQTIEKLGNELDHLQDRLEKSQRIIEAVPQGLVRYYLDGDGRDQEMAGKTREAVVELKAQWEAMDDSLSPRFVQPLVARCEAVADRAGREPPVHHYTPIEVVEMLSEIAEEWRNDNWSIKAMRWLRLNYGPG